MMPFPESGAYHGIASTGDFENLERRRLSSTAFIFNANRDSEDQTVEECSISWADSDEALYMLADQVKYDKKIDGLRPQFLGGVCRIPLASLESLRETYSECFDYNRDPMSYQGRAGTRENSHHGNLLILNAQTKATKAAKKNIVAVLAYMASPPQSDVYSRNELDKLLEDIS